MTWLWGDLLCVLCFIVGETWTECCADESIREGIGKTGIRDKYECVHGLEETVASKKFLSGQEYDKEVLVIPVDFSHGYEIYEEISKQLQGLDIGALGKQKMLKLPWEMIRRVILGS